MYVEYASVSSDIRRYKSKYISNHILYNKYLQINVNTSFVSCLHLLIIL